MDILLGRFFLSLIFFYYSILKHSSCLLGLICFTTQGVILPGLCCFTSLQGELTQGRKETSPVKLQGGEGRINTNPLLQSFFFS